MIDEHVSIRMYSECIVGERGREGRRWKGEGGLINHERMYRGETCETCET